jgi:hypothetical protein
VERIQYHWDPNPFLRTTIEYLPFSHSLLCNLVLALLVFVVADKFRGKAWGTVLALGVISHWLLDFLVHPADLPLFFDQFKVGLGLWHFVLPSFALEVLMVITGAVYCLRGTGLPKKGLLLVLLMVAGYYGMLFAPEPAVIQVDMKLRALIVLGAYGLFILLAYWSERPARAGLTPGFNPLAESQSPSGTKP